MQRSKSSKTTKAKSAMPGKRTLAVEVANVSPHGFWLMIDRTEYFVRFEAFPWFRHATIAQLMTVELPSAHHLYWPELDVDLAVESLTHPERYPLVSSPNKPTKPAKSKPRAVRR
jgi:hypothetical protein